MHKYVESILGSSPATLLRGMRFGIHDAYRSGRASFTATNPLINRQLNSIPVVAFTDFLRDGGSAIKTRIMRYEDGMLPMCDAIPLLSLLVAEQPKEVLEIGTYMGHTTRAMAENLPDSIIHTLDLPVDFVPNPTPDDALPKDDFHLIGRRVVGREFKGQPCESRIVQHFGDSAEMDFSTIGKPTFFFIDGSHTYEYCRNDSEKCLALGGGKGTFLWHDCDDSHPGVVQSLCELRETGKNIVRLDGTGLAYWKGT